MESKSSLFRSSLPEVFCKKYVLKNFTKFTGIHLRQSLFFNKVAGLRLLLLSITFFLLPLLPLLNNQNCCWQQGEDHFPLDIFFISIAWEGLVWALTLNNKGLLLFISLVNINKYSKEARMSSIFQKVFLKIIAQ